MARRAPVERVPPTLRWLFWDVDPTALRLGNDASYILPRVLEFGGLVEVQWVIRHYGLERIHTFLRDEGHPELTPKTLAFWRTLLHAEGETWRERRASRALSAAPWIS